MDIAPKITEWSGKLLAIYDILFLAMFSLTAMLPEMTWLMKAFVIFLNLFPSFIVLICLLVAWKRPDFGSIAFAAAGVLFTVIFQTYLSLELFILVSGPVFLIAVLFFLTWLLQNRAKRM
ncbi:MAG: hypothetical protein ACLFR1_11785 [Spirochaetia bacterium]